MPSRGNWGSKSNQSSPGFTATSSGVWDDSISSGTPNPNLFLYHCSLPHRLPYVSTVLCSRWAQLLPPRKSTNQSWGKLTLECPCNCALWKKLVKVSTWCNSIYRKWKLIYRKWWKIGQWLFAEGQAREKLTKAWKKNEVMKMLAV